MQARFLRLSERIGQAGLESVGEPHVKHLVGKLWELRLTGRDTPALQGWPSEKIGRSASSIYLKIEI